MKLFFSSLIYAALLLCPCLVGGQEQNLSRPKLVVGIVVDQMRHDYIYRYWNKYGDGGFKRLVLDGFSCENLHYNYVPTNTAPGHSAIYTGSTPALTGIIGNEWHVRYSRKPMYCVQDESVTGIGGSGATGQMSPRNLLATTITDELRLYTYDRAKVIGVSIKDRGSIIPAGHHPTGAYWFDSKTCHFITSSFYTQSLPSWVTSFNAQGRCNQLMQNGWTTLKPIETYIESMQDLNPYEGTLSTEKTAVFPKKFSGNQYGDLLNSPYGNTLVTEFALKAIEAEGLGTDEVTDFLAVSYSSPDYAGHLFGLQSIEIEDMYLRLDLELETMLNQLDRVVGKSQYLVFLSADHAVAQVPQLMKDQNYPGDYFKGYKMMDSLKNYLEGPFGKNIIDGYGNHQIYLNEDRIRNKKLDRSAIVATIKRFVRDQPGVVDIIDRSEVVTMNSANPIYKKIQLGYYPPLSGDLFIVIQPGWFESSSKTGTSHGSPYSYDTHVPALWYGWHIAPGKSYTAYEITDIAPTLSHLLHIPLPSASIGRPILELFK